jgi:hypothetical protein
LTAATLIEPSSTARHSGPPSAAEWMTGTLPRAPDRHAIRDPQRRQARDHRVDTARSIMDDNRPPFIERRNTTLILSLTAPALLVARAKH